jgi:hypothetical protein
MNGNTEVNTKIITACGGKGVVCTVTDIFKKLYNEVSNNIKLK